MPAPPNPPAPTPNPGPNPPLPPLIFEDEPLPSFLVVTADSVSESLMHVTVMAGGGAGKSTDIGFSMSFSIIRLTGRSLWGGGDPGNSMLGELMGVGCCMTNVGMANRLAA